MCGFVALISKGFVPNESSCARALSDLEHRGPSSQHLYREDGLIVGHTRLAIIDPRPEADQPFYDSTGRYIFVYNGEIYNHLSIRKDLIAKGHSFRTNSDTETLFILILDSGLENALRQVRGMYAFVLIDRVTQSFQAARDQFGQKPLYWYKNSELVCLSSEIRPILDLVPDSGQNPNIDSFHTYMCTTGIVETKSTFFHDIHCLPAGYIVEGDVRSTNEFEYFQSLDLFDPALFDRNKRRGEESLLEELEYLIKRAVRRHLVSDVDIGILLSGGIDSSLINAFAYDAGTPLECFTKLTPGQEHIPFDVVPQLLNQRPSFHTTYTEKTDDYWPELIQLVAQNAAPSRFASGPPMYQLCKLAKEHGVDVLLSGDATDEYFGGYNSHTRLFHDFSNDLFNLGDLLTTRRDSPYFSETHCGKFIELEHERRKIILDKVGCITNIKERFAIATMLHDSSTFLQSCNLPHSDSYSMRASVELRNPMLDLDLVAFVLNLPLCWRNGANPEDPCANKILLRRLADKVLAKQGSVPKEGTRNYGTIVANQVFTKTKDYELTKIFGLKPMDSKHTLSPRDIYRLLNLELFYRLFFVGQGGLDGMFSSDSPSEKYLQ